MTFRSGLIIALTVAAVRPALAAGDDDAKPDDSAKKADDSDKDKADSDKKPEAVKVEALAAEPKIEPPKRTAASGFFAEGGLGAVNYFGKTAKAAALGPAMSLRLGLDLFSWFSVGIFASASNHEATVPPPPEGEWFQLYRGGGDGRLGGRIERIAFFIEGGVGIAIISSNVLQGVMITDPGEKYSITFHGGGGLEYQLENRHFAIGLGIDGFFVKQFANMSALDSRLYIRYTYGGG